MNGEECCDNCRFSQNDYGQLRCHRGAPQPYSYYRFYIGELLRDVAWNTRALANIEPPKDEHDELNTQATETIDNKLTEWPPIELEDWCGEWKPK